MSTDGELDEGDEVVDEARFAAFLDMVERRLALASTDDAAILERIMRDGDRFQAEHLAKEHARESDT